MGNKHQEALDIISSHLFNDEPHHEFDLIESVETLKELIDNYENLLREKLEWQQEEIERCRNDKT